jgi:hypothetical protein
MGQRTTLQLQTAAWQLLHTTLSPYDDAAANERAEVRNENPRICCRRFAISLKRTLCPFNGNGWLNRYANRLGAIHDVSA